MVPRWPHCAETEQVGRPAPLEFNHVGSSACRPEGCLPGVFRDHRVGIERSSPRHAEPLDRVDICRRVDPLECFPVDYRGGNGLDRETRTKYSGLDGGQSLWSFRVPGAGLMTPKALMGAVTNSHEPYFARMEA